MKRCVRASDGAVTSTESNSSLLSILLSFLSSLLTLSTGAQLSNSSLDIYITKKLCYHHHHHHHQEWMSRFIRSFDYDNGDPRWTENLAQFGRSVDMRCKIRPSCTITMLTRSMFFIFVFIILKNTNYEAYLSSTAFALPVVSTDSTVCLFQKKRKEKITFSTIAIYFFFKKKEQRNVLCFSILRFFRNRN